MTEIQEINQIPTCLIAGINHFLAPFLSENLQKKGLAVIDINLQKDEISSESKKNIVYIIDLSPHPSEKLLDLSQDIGAKYLYCYDFYQEPPKQISKKFRTLALKDVFGPHMSLSSSSPLPQLLSTINNHTHPLNFPQTYPTHPLYAFDAAEIIIRFLFSRSTNPRPFVALGSTSYPLINLSLKLSPTHHPSFTNTPVPIPTINKDIQLTPKHPTNIDQALTLTLQSLAPTKKLPEPQTVIHKPVLANVNLRSEIYDQKPISPPVKKVILPTVKKTQPKPLILPKPKIKINFLYPALFSVLLSSVLLIIFIPFLLLYQSLLYTQNPKFADITPTKITSLKQDLNNRLDLANYTLSLLYNPLKIIASPLPNLLESSLSQINLYTRFYLKQAQAISVTSSLINRMLDQESGDLNSQFSELNSQVSILYNDLLFSQRFEKQTFKLPFTVGETLHKVQDKLDQAKTDYQLIRQLLSITPNILNLNGKSTHLVLLQNSQELRPTGGFISSVAVLSFEKGRLLNQEVFDIYTLDANLKGKVDPPYEISKYLGETSWFFRDANWDPNLPTTAKNTAWFFEKETNRRVDSVISLNLLAFKPILEVLGPVTIDNGQSFTAQNLEQAAFYYQDLSFKDTQKQELLGKIFTSLFNSFKSASSTKRLLAVKALLTAIRENNVQITSFTPYTQRLLSDANMSGELINPTCPSALKSPQCVTDYLQVSEANVGINKANYFISRKRTHAVTLKSDLVSHEEIITLFNTSTEASWPSGPYKTYIRLFVPENSQLSQIQIDKTPLKSDDVLVNVQHGKTTFAFYTEVPVNSQSIIEVTYTVPLVIPSSNPTAYTLLIQKQSGLPNDPLSLKISYPTTLTPLFVNHPYKVSQNNLVIDTKLDSNLFTAVEFAR